MTQADKAKKMLSALDRLSDEYDGRPDIQHAIGEFLTNVGPAQLALLHDLVTHVDTKVEALAILRDDDAG